MQGMFPEERFVFLINKGFERPSYVFWVFFFLLKPRISPCAMMLSIQMWEASGQKLQPSLSTYPLIYAQLLLTDWFIYAMNICRVSTLYDPWRLITEGAAEVASALQWLSVEKAWHAN